MSEDKNVDVEATQPVEPKMNVRDVTDLQDHELHSVYGKLSFDMKYMTAQISAIENELMKRLNAKSNNKQGALVE